MRLIFIVCFFIGFFNIFFDRRRTELVDFARRLAFDELTVDDERIISAQSDEEDNDEDDDQQDDVGESNGHDGLQRQPQAPRLRASVSSPV